MEFAPFIETGSGVHPTLNFKSLLKYYPDLPDDIWNISSASDLISWMKMRERYGIQDCDAVPCDLFIWGIGEPPDRRLTRVGGVPWLPKHISWPMIGSIIPTFFCQFDFRDSRDLEGQRVSRQLPNDILLVFVADERSSLSCDDDRFRFIWVSADEADIISSDAVPDPTHPFEFVSTWGSRFRTEDVPGQSDRAYELEEEGSERGLWRLPVLWGTKIGGIPYHSQENIEQVPKDYLCQLTSIQASSTSWPWINRELPHGQDFGKDSIYANHNDLMIGDMGELTFYLHDDGSVTTDSAC